MSALPTFIVIGGVCGCGKSTIGQALAEALPGYEYIDGDTFHPPSNVEKMSQGIPLNDDDRAGWLRTIASLGQPDKKRIVACSALKKAARDVLRNESPSGPSGTRIFILLLPESTLKQRLNSRKGHFAKSDLLKSQLETLQIPEADEHGAHAIDGTGDTSEVVNRIISSLKSD